MREQKGIALNVQTVEAQILLRSNAVSQNITGVVEDCLDTCLLSWTLRSSNRAPHGLFKILLQLGFPFQAPLLFVLWWRKRIPKASSSPPTFVCVCVAFLWFLCSSFPSSIIFSIHQSNKKEEEKSKLIHELDTTAETLQIHFETRRAMF